MFYNHLLSRTVLQFSRLPIVSRSRVPIAIRNLPSSIHNFNERGFSVAIASAMSAQDGKTSTTGPKNEWKQRPPYSIHEGDGFKALYEASCHCGKVKYQLSRDAPLDSKLCHCTTCQTQHGTPPYLKPHVGFVR